MNILVTLNSDYVYPLCVMFRSLEKNCRGEHLDIYVAYSSLTENDFRQMDAALGTADYTIHKVLVDNGIFSGAPVLDRLSKETYYRLLIGDILPADVHKILYLDPDIVINKNLSDFYNSDMSDYIVAGGTHTFGFVGRGNLMRLGLKKTSTYINAGVLLINLDKWRKTVTLSQIMDFISSNIKKLLLADQDVINVLFENHILKIDERLYNLDEKTLKKYSSKSAKEKRIDLDWVQKNTVVIHFNGKHKPWSEKNYSGKLGEFFERYK